MNATDTPTTTPYALDPTIEVYNIRAQDAPIGTPVWPAKNPKGLRRFTLTEVIVRRSAADTLVVWVAQDGYTRIFDYDEQVACGKRVDTPRPVV